MSPASKKPKVNLYRNISISFIVVTVMLLVAVFLLFSGRAAIKVSVNESEVNISFNTEVKESPSADEIADQDVVTGKVVSEERDFTETFPVLSTKTASADTVGMVKLVNNTKHDQTLVKTTQLQADNGVIVRTSDTVIVPAEGSVSVGVFPKDPATFTTIPAGNLTIIKLATSLQKDIFGTAGEALSNGPHEIKVFAASDLSRAESEIKDKIIAQVKTEDNLEDAAVGVEVIKAEADKKIGEEAADFVLKVKARISYLQINQDELVALVNRKMKNLDLNGLTVAGARMDDIKYDLVSEDGDGSALVKVSYVAKARLAADNLIFDKRNFVGKSIEDVRNYFSGEKSVRNVEILLTPYWRKTLPKQQGKIKIIVQ